MDLLSFLGWGNKEKEEKTTGSQPPLSQQPPATTAQSLGQNKVSSLVELGYIKTCHRQGFFHLFEVCHSVPGAR